MSNYATKTDLKNVTHVDTSSIASLASLKTEVGKLDIDKLVPVPVDLSKLSDVVKNDVVKMIILGRGPTQGLGEHSLTAEKMYSINFTVTNKTFCLGLHYNGANSYLFFNGTEIYKFKAKDSEIVVGPICLGNISEDWSVDNMKKIGFTGYVYDFSFDYDTTSVDDIKDIHKYLMKKNNRIWYDMIW